MKNAAPLPNPGSTSGPQNWVCWVIEGLGGWSGREACIFFFLTPRNLDSARWGLGTGNLNLRITTLERQDSTPTACGKGSLNEGRGQQDLPGVESSQQLRGRGHQDSQHFVPGIRDRWSRGAWSPQDGQVSWLRRSLHACVHTHAHFHGVRGQGPRGPGSPASLPVTLPTAVVHKQERPTKPALPSSPKT